MRRKRVRSWLRAQLVDAASIVGWAVIVLALLGGLDAAGARLGWWSKAPAIVVQDCKGVRI